MSRGGKEYTNMLHALYGDNKGHDLDEVYQELMNKEKNVLDTVDRVVNQKRRKSVRDEQFINMPVYAVVMRFGTVLSTLVSDVVKARSVRKAWAAVHREDRGIYVGLLLIIIALFLLIVQVS